MGQENSGKSEEELNEMKEEKEEEKIWRMRQDFEEENIASVELAIAKHEEIV
jgi:hypothetical protein